MCFFVKTNLWEATRAYQSCKKQIFPYPPAPRTRGPQAARTALHLVSCISVFLQFSHLLFPNRSLEDFLNVCLSQCWFYIIQPDYKPPGEKGTQAIRGRREHRPSDEENKPSGEPQDTSHQLNHGAQATRSARTRKVCGSTPGGAITVLLRPWLRTCRSWCRGCCGCCAVPASAKRVDALLEAFSWLRAHSVRDSEHQNMLRGPSENPQKSVCILVAKTIRFLKSFWRSSEGPSPILGVLELAEQTQRTFRKPSEKCILFGTKTKMFFWGCFWGSSESPALIRYQTYIHIFVFRIRV